MQPHLPVCEQNSVLWHSHGPTTLTITATNSGRGIVPHGLPVNGALFGEKELFTLHFKNSNSQRAQRLCAISVTCVAPHTPLRMHS